MRSRIIFSEARSAAVTKSASPLYSMTTLPKYCMSNPPASRAISSSPERKLRCLIFAMQYLWSFGDVHDVVLEDEQIRVMLTCQAEHVSVVILNPPLDDLPILQLDGDRMFASPQIFEVVGLSRGVIGRSRFGIARIAPWKPIQTFYTAQAEWNAYFGLTTLRKKASWPSIWLRIWWVLPSLLKVKI